MKITRRKTSVIRIGRVRIGGDNPVAIQSMVKVPTRNAAEAIRQIRRLEAAGCEIVRVAVKDPEDARAIRRIRQAVRIPLVADIHFHWKLALEAIESGADKVRLNPGNIYKPVQIKEVARAARRAGIPIRVGLNSGSLPQLGASTFKGKSVARRMVEGASRYIAVLERSGCRDIVVSLKASAMTDTIEAYRLMASRCAYPFHLGVTATGLTQQGVVLSSIAIGSLLLEGIGDTIRVSLTDKPEEEVRAARSILEAVGLRRFGPQVISCPTCGRCEIDLIRIVRALEKQLSSLDCRRWKVAPKVAVMGCMVNGPGEARDADIGIAFGKKEGMLFKNGAPVKKVAYARCIEVLLEAIRGMHA